MADEGYILDGELLRQIRDVIEWRRNFRVTGAKGFRNSDRGCHITLPPIGRDESADPERAFFIMIDGATQDASLTRWFYSWHKVRKLTAGYFDGLGPSSNPWDVALGAVSGPSSTYGYAYNGAENISYGTGLTQTYGNGWTQPAIASVNGATGITWSIRAITQGTIVWANLVQPEAAGALPEVWFTMPNVLRPGA